MSAFVWFESAVIGVAVTASAAVALRRLMPTLTTRWLAGLSAGLNKPWRARPVRWLGRRLQPGEATGSCGSGCGSCGACGPAPAAEADTAQPLRFRPRERR